MLADRTRAQNDLAGARKWVDRAKLFHADSEVILEKERGTFLGLCGLVTQEVDGVIELEVGYHFFLAHWGRGYATEAARMFLDFAATHKLSESVVSLINPDNVAAQMEGGIGFGLGAVLHSEVTFTDGPEEAFFNVKAGRYVVSKEGKEILLDTAFGFKRQAKKYESGGTNPFW